MNIILPHPKQPKDRSDIAWGVLDLVVSGIRSIMNYHNNKNLSSQAEFWRAEAEAQRLRAERLEAKTTEEEKECSTDS